VTRALALATVLAWAAAAPVAHAATPSSQVNWLSAANAQDVQAAFLRAQSAKQPVLLYWGATWCPPCNQLKATLFNRQDFAALSRSFVAVHVDGDRPGAQKLGQQFKVGGYPTLVLFKPDGSEITRLPGEAEASQVMELLRLGMAGGRPAAQVLADARAGKRLTADEWRLLAFYSWETDDEQLLGRDDAAAVLSELAPQSEAAGSRAGAETATRLWMKAVAASDDGKGLKADDALRQRVQAVLADRARWRPQADVLVNSAPDMVRALGDSEVQRAAVARLFEPALRQLEGDASLSRADRLSALASRIELARLELPKAELHPRLPEPLVKDLRSFVGQADHGIVDPYERQAVIPFAAHTLERAGLWAESETLLTANLARSASAYYLMSQLGSLHRKLGRTDEALRWYGQAFDKSQGPATRLQWGASYLQALVDLSPGDAVRIEATATRLFDEAASDDGAFYKRSAGSMKRVGRALRAWSKDGSRAESIQRLQTRLSALCNKVDAAEGRRDTCRAVLPVPVAAAG
jgi:thioredoxin-like negative regulator of GroEL